MTKITERSLYNKVKRSLKYIEKSMKKTLKQIPTRLGNNDKVKAIIDSDNDFLELIETVDYKQLAVDPDLFKYFAMKYFDCNYALIEALQSLLRGDASKNLYYIKQAMNEYKEEINSLSTPEEVINYWMYNRVFKEDDVQSE